MTRISRDEWGLRMAEVVALRATCLRRSVGCVAVDELGIILATGYNGVPRGAPHCIDHPCAGIGFPSGEGLDICEALHAEQNCVAFCHNAQLINTIYVTVSPCVSCVKLLLATGCRRVVFREPYPGEKAQKLWETNGRIWSCISSDINDETEDGGRTAPAGTPTNPGPIASGADLVDSCLAAFHGEGAHGWRLLKQQWPDAAIHEQRRKMEKVILIAQSALSSATAENTRLRALLRKTLPYVSQSWGQINTEITAALAEPKEDS